LLLVAAAVDSRLRNHHSVLAAKEDPLHHFTEWVEKHAKEYRHDLAEFNKRFGVWMSNLEYVLEYNSKHTSHWLGMNALADLTHDEYRSLLGYNHELRTASNRLSTSFKYADVPESSLPTSIDWRKKGAVTEVKNQQQCGSCWAFSTTGSVEGINAIVTKQLVSLSEQELVDCDTSQDNGCNGGLMDFAFQFIINNGGLDTEDDYPYTATGGQCKLRKRDRHVVSIDGFEDVPENNEIALKKAVAHQPVSVAIEADQKSFQLYMGGVFDDLECGTSLDHGVLAVGYGYDEEKGTYWIVKNSWGPEWGDNGYILLKMGVEAKEGLCGIAMSASYPLKTHPNPPSPSPGPGPTPSPTPGPTPGPTPDPVKCDMTTECPADTTCCCSRSIFGFCFSWGCCSLPDAVCCDDHEHCCPGDLPVCDTDEGRCLPSKGVIAGSVPWTTQTRAQRRGLNLRQWV